MTKTELIQMVARRMNGDEAEAAVSYICRLDDEDLEYYERTGISGLIECIRGEYVNYDKPTDYRAFAQRF